MQVLSGRVLLGPVRDRTSARNLFDTQHPTLMCIFIPVPPTSNHIRQFYCQDAGTASLQNIHAEIKIIVHCPATLPHQRILPPAHKKLQRYAYHPNFKMLH